MSLILFYTGFPVFAVFQDELEASKSQMQVSNLSFENDATRNRFPMTLTSGTFLNQKRKKQTMNYRRILIAAVFHSVHPAEKDS